MLALASDIPALAAVVVLSLVLMRSTSESSLLNIVVVTLHMLLILFVVCAGFPFVKVSTRAMYTVVGCENKSNTGL